LGELAKAVFTATLGTGYSRTCNDDPKSQAFLSTDAGIQAMTAYTVTVTFRLKQGVLDPEAETTRKALERLGFELDGLRSADRFELDLDAESAADASERAEEMAERLLANPTIHDYEIAVSERE
jgi:phosphoribosylformylglycinamidine synthase PurS subunit